VGQQLGQVGYHVDHQGEPVGGDVAAHVGGRRGRGALRVGVKEVDEGQRGGEAAGAQQGLGVLDGELGHGEERLLRHVDELDREQPLAEDGHRPASCHLARRLG